MVRYWAGALAAFIFLFAAVPLAQAQTAASSTSADSVGVDAPVATETYEKAVVLQVLGTTTEDIADTMTSEQYQTIDVQILQGPDAGKTVIIDNDFLMLKKGDVFYALHNVDPDDGIDAYTVAEPYRIPLLIWLAVLFVAVLLIFGGKQGLRGLLSLIASFFFIGYLLLPGILAGISPVLVAFGVSALIVGLGSYVTHGFNKTTTAAVIGMVATILVTGALAYVAVYGGQFSGYTSDDATYLNVSTHGTIDFVGLFLGGIMIGLLGILYDAAIGQAIAVEELLEAGLTRGRVLRRALRMGREHIGALVNTLAIAYVGASLPLLLLFEISNQQSFAVTINQEIISSQIVRILVGSIGLVLAVPITTLIAVYVLSRHRAEVSAGSGPEAVHHH
ncbi:MAG: YibE/F family protein [Minisyncoccia bacterium]